MIYMRYSSLCLRPYLTRGVRALPRGSDHVAGNDELLDLRSSLVQPIESHVAIEPLDFEVCNVDRAAVDLLGTVGDSPHHLGAKVLTSCRKYCDILPCVATLRCIEHHAARRERFGAAIRQRRLHQLVLGDRPVELHTLHCILLRVADEPFRGANCSSGDVQSSAVQGLHSRLETNPLFASSERRRKHSAVVKDDVAGM